MIFGSESSRSVAADPCSRPVGGRPQAAAQCDGLRVEPQVTLAGLPQRPVDRLANEISGVGGSGFDQIEKRDEFFIAAFLSPTASVAISAKAVRRTNSSSRGA